MVETVEVWTGTEEHFLTRFESQSGHHNVINYKARILSILNNNNNPLFYECNVGYVYFTTFAAMSKLVIIQGRIARLSDVQGICLFKH